MSQNKNYDDLEWVAVCKSHKIDAMIMTGNKCPDCNDENSVVPQNYKRCKNCALQQNKCSYCDAPLNT